jgi:hypothetical protein
LHPRTKKPAAEATGEIVPYFYGCRADGKAICLLGAAVAIGIAGCGIIAATVTAGIVFLAAANVKTQGQRQHQRGQLLHPVAPVVKSRSLAARHSTRQRRFLKNTMARRESHYSKLESRAQRLFQCCTKILQNSFRIFPVCFPAFAFSLRHNGFSSGCSPARPGS